MIILNNNVISDYITAMGDIHRLEGESVETFLIRLFPNYAMFAEWVDKEFANIVVSGIPKTDEKHHELVTTYLNSISILELYASILKNCPTEFKEMAILFGYEQISIMLSMVKMMMIGRELQTTYADELLMETLKMNKPTAEA